MENENKTGISVPPVVINALYTTGGYHNKVNMAKLKNLIFKKFNVIRTLHVILLISRETNEIGRCVTVICGIEVTKKDVAGWKQHKLHCFIIAGRRRAH